jgi:hypothetical protein
MSGMRQTILGVLTAATAVAALAASAASASAEELVAGSEDAAEVIVAGTGLPGRERDQPLPFAEAGIVVTSTVAPSRPGSVRTSRVVPARHTRPPQNHPGCFDIWCGRQIVLMLGVGY